MSYCANKIMTVKFIFIQAIGNRNQSNLERIYKLHNRMIMNDLRFVCLIFFVCLRAFIVLHSLSLYQMTD